MQTTTGNDQQFYTDYLERMQAKSKPKYLKLNDKENRKVRFSKAKRPHMGPVTFGEGTNPVDKHIFHCWDLTNDPKAENELEWAVGFKTAQKVIRKLQREIYTLSITRYGTGINDTDYEVEEAKEDNDK